MLLERLSQSMKRFCALENPREFSIKQPIILLLYISLIGVISHYALTPASIGKIRHPRPIHLHDNINYPNYLVQGDSLILDDESTNDSDTKKTFTLFLALCAGLITVPNSGLNRGALKSPINLFLYDSTYGYSPLRSPPSI